MRKHVSQNETGHVLDYTFRLKLRQCSRTSVDIDDSRLEWPLGASHTLVLSSGSKSTSIRDAEILYLRCGGWSSETEAIAAAERYGSAFLRSLARLRIGVDEGNRGPSGGGLAPEVIRRLHDEQGARVINDRWGLMVYETDPQPLFSSSSADVGRLSPARHFRRVFESALEGVEPLSDRERLSLDLFNASFFQVSADARLLMLMMAIEALLDPASRGAASVEHVDQLVALTQSNGSLDESEKASMAGILRLVRRESIRQTGVKLVDQLGDRTYMDMAPAKFFDHCYGIRSSLVHGVCPLPSHGEVSHAAAVLETMVSDLLAGHLRDIDPNSEPSG